MGEKIHSEKREMITAKIAKGERREIFWGALCERKKMGARVAKEGKFVHLCI